MNDLSENSSLESGQPVRILLVEDNPDDVWTVRSLLAHCWNGPYELIHVEFLSEALECCAMGGIDVALLDLSLPDCSGMDTFFGVFAKHEEIPIIVLTDLNDETTAAQAVQAGAQDYLVKSQTSDRLLVRSIRYGMERHRRRRVEQILQTRWHEFRAAQEIQRRLSPAEPPGLPGFDIAGGVFPSKSPAGDYYDHFHLSDGSLAVALGDVGSHGAEPTFVMAEARACLRTLAQTCCDVGEILSRANRFLSCDIEQLHFVTLALLRLEPRKRSLAYASAGQRGYLIDPDRKKPIVLDSTCPPLGANRQMAAPPSLPVYLQPGHLVAFFTDGVVETSSPDGHRFGVRRALEVVRGNAAVPASQIVDRLHAAVQRFCQPGAPDDDATALVIKAEPGE